MKDCLLISGSSYKDVIFEEITQELKRKKIIYKVLRNSKIYKISSSDDLSFLREKYKGKAFKEKCDFNLFKQEEFKFIAFDMDSTLLTIEVIDELAKKARVGEQVSLVTERAMKGEIDFLESLCNRVSLLRGLPENAIEEVRMQLPLSKGVEELMRSLKDKGIKSAVLSGGFSYFARELQRSLGFDYVYANELEIKNKKLTGELKGEIIDASKKAFYLEKIAKDNNFLLKQTICVGDGANDLKMLSKSGLGIAYKAKPIVRQLAQCSMSFSDIDDIFYFF